MLFCSLRRRSGWRCQSQELCSLCSTQPYTLFYPRSGFRASPKGEYLTKTVLTPRARTSRDLSGACGVPDAGGQEAKQTPAVGSRTNCVGLRLIATVVRSTSQQAELGCIPRLSRRLRQAALFVGDQSQVTSLDFALPF